MTLAYTPFIDAMSVHDYWYLLIVPMAFFLAVGYKAVRCPDMKKYPQAVLSFTVQILGLMLLLAIAFTIVIGYVLPMLAPMPV
ncbi:MAG: hypothetical protein P1U42_07020 [Phycisphaerales bacterium]|nr:hypothetical protein [Phycisphaerales bacterium]